MYPSPSMICRKFQSPTEEYLIRHPVHTFAFQELLETKFNALVDELSKYKDAALELAKKNLLIDELKERVGVLESVVAKKSGASEQEYQDSV